MNCIIWTDGKNEPGTMGVRFKDDDLAEVEEGPGDGGLSQSLAKSFRKRMQFIRAAQDERDFYAMRSMRSEKLKGARDHQYSIRLNDQWRLILEFEGKGEDRKVVIVGIEDYH